MATSLNVSYVPATFKTLAGGLNSTSGSLNVDDAEASDLLNIDFNRFGSVLKRNGYAVLNSVALSGASQGLHWFQGLYGEYAVTVNNGKLYKMDNLDGQWDDVSGVLSIGGSQDSYTKLYLKMDGSNQSTTFTDSSSTPKNVYDVVTYDSYTVLMVHASDADYVVTFTDATAKTITNVESYDSYTVTMLHFSGNDGDGYTTDSSLSVHLFSTNTNAQIDTAQYKFSPSSLYLDGSSYLYSADSDDWNLSNGAFTIDYWIMIDSLAVDYAPHFAQGQNPNINVEVQQRSNGEIRFIGGATIDITTSGAGIVEDTWYHIAIVRSGNTFTVYINGEAKGTQTAVVSLPDYNGNFEIGYDSCNSSLHLTGWVDEFRISKGIARWTKNFNPNPYPYGKVRISTASSYFLSSSAFFPGDSGYLNLADSADWYFSSSDFTVDFFLKRANTQTGTAIYLCGQTDTGVINGFNMIITSAGKLQSVLDPAGTYYALSSVVLDDTNWHHIAFVRNGNTGSNYIDGIISGNVDLTGVSTTNSPGTWSIGAVGGYSIHNYCGYIDEFRVSKGIARWTDNFTPWRYEYGTPANITGEKKVGSGSGEIKDGAGLYLVTSTDWSFSTSNFTVDTWVNFNNLQNAQTLISQYKSGTQHWYLNKKSAANGNKLQMVFINTTSKADYSLTNNWGVTKNQWYHLAFMRSGTNGYIYIDGVSQALTSVTAFGTNDVGMFTDTNLCIGHYSGSNYFCGYLDNFRVSKGITRWNSSFTPPTEAYGSFLKQDMTTFLGYTLGTDPENIPWSWAAQNATATNMTVPTSLTGAKLITKFQNYCFLGNVRLGAVQYNSRVYFSAISNFNSWDDAEYIDISPDDGQEITGLKELADRLIVYKNHSIYVIIFTGDADIPFIVQKTNSAVGCAASGSIQANENGHIFASYDGVYFFDGVNSYKLSDRINETYSGINKERLSEATSLYQKEKNKYWLSLPSGSSLYNNFILTWDSFLNAWSKYDGFSATSLELFVIDNTDERPYFGDENGYYYRADYGSNDYPCNTNTAINSYFYTNWKYYETLCDKKGMPHVYIAHRNESNTVLTFNYAYDFYNGDQYTQSFSAASTLSVTALTTRRDLTGRGRFVRLGLSNNQTNSSFRIDGIGTYVTKEGMS